MDISNDPFVTQQLLQSGNTLADPYAAQVYQFPALAAAYQQYANLASEAEKTTGASNRALTKTAFDSIGGLIGKYQEESALRELQNKLAGQYNDPAPAGTQTFANNYTPSTGLYRGDVGTLDAAPGTEQRKRSIEPIDIINATKGLRPEVANKIVNGFQATQERQAAAEIRKQELADKREAQKQEREEIALVKKAELEERTKKGKELTTAFGQAQTVDEKQAVIESFAGEPSLTAQLGVLQRSLNYDNTQLKTTGQLDKIEASIANLNARTGDIGANASSRDALRAAQTAAPTVLDPNTRQPIGAQSSTLLDHKTRRPLGNNPINWKGLSQVPIISKTGGVVSENPAVGNGKVGGHNEGSQHYRGNALDVNWPGGDKVERAKANAAATYFRGLGYNAIVEEKGGKSTGLHLHIDGGPRAGGGAVSNKTVFAPQTAQTKLDNTIAAQNNAGAIRAEAAQTAVANRPVKAAASGSGSKAENKAEEKAVQTAFAAATKRYEKQKETYDKRANSKVAALRTIAGPEPVPPTLESTRAQVTGKPAASPATVYKPGEVRQVGKFKVRAL